MAYAAGCRDNARECAPRQQDFAMVTPHSQEELAEYVLRVALPERRFAAGPWFPAGPAGISFHLFGRTAASTHA
jgi:hypothetical protein